MIERELFERILDETVKRLNGDVRQNNAYHDPKAFELRVREVLIEQAAGHGITIDPTFHPHAFPDIKANGYGIEVKTTTKDSWLSVGNSVFEGMRDETVSEIYVVFGKFGGAPAVRSGKYEEMITHVRISHAPRFVLEMTGGRSLFDHLNVSYEDFAKLSSDEKMRHIRRYSRSRLTPGEHLWWLEDEEDEGLPLAPKLFMNLSADEKVRFRAEAALLCPEVVKPRRAVGKYKNAAQYLLTHGVFAPQTRDLFSAGSVAGKETGGIYVQRSLEHIQDAMREAARYLDNELFEEYWKESAPPDQRIRMWLRKADSYATEWTPSDHLFLEEQGKK
jgi:hypothetical protein